MFILSATTALYIGSTSYSKAYVGDVQVWPMSTDYSKQYLTFEILSGGTIMFKTDKPASSITREIQYSINNGQWATFNSSGNTGFTVTAGDKVRLKGVNARYCTLGNTSPRATFQASTAVFNVYGNLMSMIYGDSFIGQDTLDAGGYNFVGFFGSAKVVNAENLVLPMDVIPERGLLNFMIQSPTLEYGPKEIPATSIGDMGMQGAFARCKKLIKASEYSVKTVGASGLSQTYTDCYSLVEPPSILPIETMGSYGCFSMFANCSGMTTAPVLPAATIPAYGYRYMFRYCRHLNYIKCLATSLGSNACAGWTQSVAATGTFVKASGSTWTIGSNGIPRGWVVEDEPIPPVTGNTLTHINSINGLSVGDSIVLAGYTTVTISGTIYTTQKIVAYSANTNNYFYNAEFDGFDGNDGIYVIPSNASIFTVVSISNNQVEIKLNGNTITAKQETDGIGNQNYVLINNTNNASIRIVENNNNLMVQCNNLVGYPLVYDGRYNENKAVFYNGIPTDPKMYCTYRIYKI